jgi:tRNA(His) 5'-end guanylyltransferase
VGTDDTERNKDEAWANVCESEGWTCRVCGVVPPERGKRFEGDLCDDCRLIARNE